MNANQILERLNAISNSLSLETLTTKKLCEARKEKHHLLMIAHAIASSEEYLNIKRVCDSLQKKCDDLYMEISTKEDENTQKENSEKLFLWTQDASWAGCLVVVAKNEESARKLMTGHYNYEDAKPVEKHEIVDGFTYVNIGDA